MIIPIRCGVDTLEATFQGDIEFWFMKEFVKRKEAAQLSGDPDPIRICNENLFVSPRGAGLWSHVMRNDDMMLRFALVKNVPPLSVKLLSQGLASRGVGQLWSKTKEIASEATLSPMNLTRIDVAVDFQGWTPTYEEMLNVACSSNFRPVYPNTTNPETFQFGKGAVVVRLYNKTKEVVVSGKSWWHSVWKLCGYDPDQDVWRLEVQLRSEALKGLSMRRVDTALDNIYGLFSYGLDWCSVKVPTGDSNISRRPEHQAWIDLRREFAPSRSLGRIRPVVSAMEYDAAVARIAGNLASAGAAIDMTDLDEIAAAVILDVDAYVHRRHEMEFCEFVEQKRRRRNL